MVVKGQRLNDWCLGVGLDPGRENSAWNPEIRPEKVISPITWCDWLTVTIQSREVTVNGNRTVKSNVPQYLVSVRKFGLVTGDLFSERWNRILNVDPPPCRLVSVGGW